MFSIYFYILQSPVINDSITDVISIHDALLHTADENHEVYTDRLKNKIRVFQSLWYCGKTDKDSQHSIQSFEVSICEFRFSLSR